MKARVWAYRDGTLLQDGFEATATGKGYDDDSALVPCLIALLESAGIEVCIGNDDADPEDLGFNEEVEEWEDVTETTGLDREDHRAKESLPWGERYGDRGLVEDVEAAHREATMEAWAREMTGD